jgi:hypothetical protein
MPAPFGIDRFLNIRAALAPTFSPDGRFVAFLTSITGVSQLWQVPVEGGWPVQLTFSRDSVRSAHYNPRKHELIYSMDTGGNERTQLYLLRGLGNSDHGLGDGWTSIDLTQKPKAIHTFGGWSHDGERFALPRTTFPLVRGAPRPRGRWNGLSITPRPTCSAAAPSARWPTSTR